MPDPTILKMTVDDALALADDWTKGLTLHPLSEGMRVAILVLATEVRRLQSNQRAMCALADERAGETFEAKLEAAKLRADAERYRTLRRYACWTGCEGGVAWRIDKRFPSPLDPRYHGDERSFDRAVDDMASALRDREASNAG